MKKSVKILIICLLITALCVSGIYYLIMQTRDDELLIGEDRACQTALRDAGLSEPQVSHLKAKLKLDDGVWYYDVEFETIALEYEYEIEAYSAAVLARSVDNN